MAHEPVGPETDRLLLEAVVAHSLDVLLRHHPARAADERAIERHEVGPGLVQLEAHAVRIDDRDLPHLVVQDLRSLGAMEAELHVLGGERIAVVELEPLTQLELVDALIRAHRPGFGQARRHEIAGHGFHERVVDRVEDPERREPLELAGVEPHGRQGHVQRPPHLPFRLWRRSRPGLGTRLSAGNNREQSDSCRHHGPPRESPCQSHRRLHTQRATRSGRLAGP